MKTMTCKQLGGACDKEFRAETFEEMVKLSQEHGMDMYQAGDQAHIAVMEKIKESMMNNPQAMQEWADKVRKEFDALPED